MRHEEATDSAVAESMETPSPPSPLMALRHPAPDLSRPDVAVTWEDSPGRLTQRVESLEAHCDRIANYVQPLPTRDDYEALLAENAALRERLTAIETVLHDLLQLRRVA